MFMAKHGGALRRTRQEAERDECDWRIANPPPEPQKMHAVRLQARARLAPAAPVVATDPQVFPAALMERKAREHAWVQFLAHVNYSLIAWQIDVSIHAHIEKPTDWMARCCGELRDMLPKSSTANAQSPGTRQGQMSTEKGHQT